MSRPLNAYEEKLLATIERVGWQVTLVAPSSNAPASALRFGYTIGLSATFGWPELIAFGLSTRRLLEILNDSVAELRTKAAMPRPGLLLDKVLTDYPAKLVDFPREYWDDHVISALWFAKHKQFQLESVLQVTWPDVPDGRFPDDPLCDPEVRRLQTPFSEDGRAP